VIAVNNTTMNFGQHVAMTTVTGMPVSGRVRVDSLRALPMTTSAVSTIAGQKCALLDPTRVIDGYRLVAGVAVVTGAFVGTSAWSPPI
jgi:hypothetical protein